MTALLTGLFKNVCNHKQAMIKIGEERFKKKYRTSASDFNFDKIIDEISSAANCLVSPLNSTCKEITIRNYKFLTRHQVILNAPTCTIGLPPAPATTLNGLRYIANYYSIQIQHDEHTTHQSFISSCTQGSSIFRPINLLTS